MNVYCANCELYDNCTIRIRSRYVRSDTFLLLTSVVWTGEEVGRRVCEVFTELSRELWLLKDLPLAITSLQGTSPVFRHTEVWKGRVEGERRGSGKGRGIEEGVN